MVRILIVDDDPVQRRLLENAVQRFGYETTCVDGGIAALDAIKSQVGANFSLIILDLVMPDLDGMGVLEELRRSENSTPVIVQTAQGGIDTVVSAMRAGAYDFVVKPVSMERLKVSMENALKVDALESELKRVKRAVTGTLTFDDVITSSERMQKVVSLGKRAANSSIPILIEGESGVGKEMIARAIQGSSDRRKKPFVTVNCGAIPSNLVESILFGHEKGAFTGANEKHIGKFQEADGGTLFLDEIGELPLEVQVKLLRAIQEGEVDPVGARRPVSVNIRLISATNRSLMDMVRDGTFREDLYYRLNVFPIWMPPLRERLVDVPHLARHFLARFAVEESRRHINGISNEAIDLISHYSWPGNIRQLENAVFRAVILCEGDTLQANDFPQVQQSLSEANGAAPQGALPTPQQENDPDMIGFAADTALERQLGTVATLSEPHVVITDAKGHARTFAELEAEIIQQAYDHYKGRISEIARRLKLGRSTLYRKMKEYGIGELNNAEDSDKTDEANSAKQSKSAA